MWVSHWFYRNLDKLQAFEGTKNKGWLHVSWEAQLVKSSCGYAMARHNSARAELGERKRWPFLVGLDSQSHSRYHLAESQEQTLTLFCCRKLRRCAASGVPEVDGQIFKGRVCWEVQRTNGTSMMEAGWWLVGGLNPSSTSELSWVYSLHER